MAWQSTKVTLYAKEEKTNQDGTVTTIISKYHTSKSKGKGKPTKKLVLKKFCPVLNKRVVHKEIKFKS